MLVLGRKTEQAIFIGDDIKITVVDVQGKLVKLGVEAPKQTMVLRGELKHSEKYHHTITVQDIEEDEKTPETGVV